MISLRKQGSCWFTNHNGSFKGICSSEWNPEIMTTNLGNCSIAFIALLKLISAVSHVKNKAHAGSLCCISILPLEVPTSSWCPTYQDGNSKEKSAFPVFNKAIKRYIYIYIESDWNWILKKVFEAIQSSDFFSHRKLFRVETPLESTEVLLPTEGGGGSSHKRGKTNFHAPRLCRSEGPFLSCHRSMRQMFKVSTIQLWPSWWSSLLLQNVPQEHRPSQCHSLGDFLQ